MNRDGLMAYYERIADAPDAVAQLRRFVLDLAVRGRLVAQDPAEEPALELLKRIVRERVRLSKSEEGKKPNLAAKTITPPSGINTPVGWVITTLQAICESITDGDHLPPPKASEGVAFLVIGNVRHQRIDFTNTRFVAQTYYDALDASRRPRVGDLLYTLVGSFGIPVIVRDDRPFCVQRHIGIIRPCKQIDLRFLARLMESHLILDQAKACATGIAQKTVSLSGLRKFTLPLPPFAEQRRIVAKVDELMTLCDRLEAARVSRETTRDRLAAASLNRLNTPDPDTFPTDARFALDALPALTTRPNQIKQLRQTILNLAVRGKLVHPAIEDLSAPHPLEAAQVGGRGRDSFTTRSTDSAVLHMIPEHWRWAALGQLITFGPQNGLSPKPTNQPDAPRAITLTATTSGTFDPTCYKRVEVSASQAASFWLCDGDLLFQRGNTREYVGMAAIYRGPPETYLFPDLMIRVRVSEQMSLTYVHLVSISPPARAFFSLSASGAQATMPKINQATLLSLPVPVPPLAEQHRIVAKVTELMTLCDQLEASLTAATTARTRLLEATLREAVNSAETSVREAAE